MSGSALDPGGCLTCNGPGDLRCRMQNASATHPSDWDHIDKRVCDEMWQHVDNNVETKNFEGTHQVIMQVEEETFKRVYTVTWALGAKGEGLDTFTREDIEN